MYRLASLALAAISPLVSGHSAMLPEGATAPVDCSKGSHPPVFSYHIHIVYDIFTKDQVDAAYALRTKAREYFKDIAAEDCSCKTDPNCRYDHTQFCFIIDHELETTLQGGPFPSGEWSVFIPVAYMAPVLQWFTAHYKDTHELFTLLLHPNTGCEYEDHTQYSLWAGDRWPLNTGIFKQYGQTNEFNQTRGGPTSPVCLANKAVCAVNSEGPDMACCQGQTCDCGMGGCTCETTTDPSNFLI